MIRVLYSWAEIPVLVEEIGKTEARRAVWIVIDVLRATSTIVAAFEAGCLAMVPVTGVAEARRLRRAPDSKGRLLSGERNGKPIRGFDLGNSPREFTPERVAGRELVHTTVNGTRTLGAVSDLGARNIWLASFGNAHAVARRAAKQRGHGRKESLHILCSGKEGRFCLEDAVCAGLIVESDEDQTIGIDRFGFCVLESLPALPIGSEGDAPNIGLGQAPDEFGPGSGRGILRPDELESDRADMFQRRYQTRVTVHHDQNRNCL